MSKRYIVALDSSTNEQNDALKAFIKENGLVWWYWIKNFWLITDSQKKVSALDIRDVLMRTHPKADCFVIELGEHGDTWAGFGPATEERNMFKWIEKNWEKDN